MSAHARRLSTLIMAGGKGERLFPLTKYRAKPAVPFGGTYRIIDFTLSNCVNSGLRRLSVLTQYKSKSLQRHLKMGWSIFHSELNEYIDFVPAQKRVGENWYRGTADAVCQNLYTLEQENPDHVLILAADHVYRMDYARMLEFHIEKRADVTIGVVERPQRESVHYGVVQVEKDSRIEGFEEKPKKPTTIPGKANRIYASMGIYIFNTQVLFEELRQDAKTASDHDFGKNIIPQMMGRRDLCAYRFSDRNHGGDAYWKDIGTLDAYYLANMDLVSARPSFDLYDTDWPIRTYEPQVPPAKIMSAADGENAINGETVDSIVSHGCIISGGCVVRSVLSPGVRVNCNSSVEDSVLMEGVDVGRDAKVRNAVIDKHVTIPPAARIGYDLTEDQKRYIVTGSGIVVVEKGMTIEPYQATHQRRKIPLDGDRSTVYQLDVQRLPLQVSI